MLRGGKGLQASFCHSGLARDGLSASTPAHGGIVGAVGQYSNDIGIRTSVEPIIILHNIHYGSYGSSAIPTTQCRQTPKNQHDNGQSLPHRPATRLTDTAASGESSSDHRAHPA